MDSVSWLSGTCVLFQKHWGVTSKASFKKGNNIEGSARKDLKLNREIPHCIYYWESWFLRKVIQVQSSTGRLFSDIYITHFQCLLKHGAQLLLFWLQEWHATLISSGRQKIQSKVGVKRFTQTSNIPDSNRRKEARLNRVEGIFQANCKGYISDPLNEGDLLNIKSEKLEWASTIPAAPILFSHIK